MRNDPITPTAQATLAVVLLETEASIEAISSEWDRLHEKVTPRLPFSTPLWVLLWWRAYQRASLSANDRLCVFAFRNAEAELVAIAPMFITYRPGFGPVRTRELQFIGADTNVTEVRGPLCDPELIEPIASAIASLMEERNLADWIQWRGLRCRSLPDHFTAKEKLSTSMHILHLPRSWDALRGSLSRNMKEALRKCYNSLARENIAVQLRVVRKADEVEAGLQHFFTLHAMRSQATNATLHVNVFACDRSKEFLRAYCAAMAESGHVRLFLLTASEKVVACRIGFQFGQELYLYYSGFDTRWSRFSIMTTAVAETIKWAIDNGLTIVNLSTGTDKSKTRWRPESIIFLGGITKGSSFKARTSAHVLTFLRGWKSARAGGGSASRRAI